MKSNDLRALVNQRPFRTIEVTLTSGHRIHVSHPELIVLGDSMAVLLEFENGEQRPAFFYYDEIAAFRLLPRRRTPRKRTSRT